MRVGFAALLAACAVVAVAGLPGARDTVTAPTPPMPDAKAPPGSLGKEGKSPSSWSKLREKFKKKGPLEDMGKKAWGKGSPFAGMAEKVRAAADAATGKVVPAAAENVGNVQEKKDAPQGVRDAPWGGGDKKKKKSWLDPIKKMKEKMAKGMGGDYFANLKKKMSNQAGKFATAHGNVGSAAEGGVNEARRLLRTTGNRRQLLPGVPEEKLAAPNGAPGSPQKAWEKLKENFNKKGPLSNMGKKAYTGFAGMTEKIKAATKTAGQFAQAHTDKLSNATQTIKDGINPSKSNFWGKGSGAFANTKGGASSAFGKKGKSWLDPIKKMKEKLGKGWGTDYFKNLKKRMSEQGAKFATAHGNIGSAAEGGANEARRSA